MDSYASERLVKSDGWKTEYFRVGSEVVLADAVFEVEVLYGSLSKSSASAEAEGVSVADVSDSLAVEVLADRLEE